MQNFINLSDKTDLSTSFMISIDNIETINIKKTNNKFWQFWRKKQQKYFVGILTKNNGVFKIHCETKEEAILTLEKIKNNINQKRFLTINNTNESFSYPWDQVHSLYRNENFIEIRIKGRFKDEKITHRSNYNTNKEAKEAFENITGS